MSLPPAIIPILAAFAPAFTCPTYEKVVVLVIGTILGQGRRTVTSALRVLGLQGEAGWAKYHHVLNRASWSGLVVSRLLLLLLVATFVAAGAPIAITVDETLERRWGRQIHKRGHWRDSLASSRSLNVSTSGLRWLVFAVVVRLPWSRCYWSLPFLSVLLTTPEVSAKLGKRHKTVAQVTSQVVCWLRRLLPGRTIELIGDGAYSVVALGLRCQHQGVRLITTLRLDARLFDHPSPKAGRRRLGRPAVVGQRLPTLAQIAGATSTRWQRCWLPWYGGQTKRLDWTTGTALWYSTGLTPLPMRWVLVRDPDGLLPTRAYCSTDVHQAAHAILAAFVKRWSLEVTFEESRQHLGIETQRQWSDKAIERTTPALFGLFSLVTLFGHALYPDGRLPLPQAAWYDKTEASFHDLLALVRLLCWRRLLFQTDALSPDLALLSPLGLERLLAAVCY